MATWNDVRTSRNFKNALDVGMIQIQRNVCHNILLHAEK